MRVLVGLALTLLLGTAVWAQDEEEDEANPGLIPTGGLMVFYTSEGPLSFVSMSPRDIPPDAALLGDVYARSCQYGLSIPLSLSLRATSVSGSGGNGGYRKALERLRRLRPDIQGIYDVKVDLQTTSLLGIFRRLCTEVSARAFGRKPSPPEGLPPASPPSKTP